MLADPHPVANLPLLVSHRVPTLALSYSLYNSLPDSPASQFSLLLFANDTQIGCLTPPGRAASHLQPAAEAITDWARSVGRTFNDNKSVHMLLHKPSRGQSQPEIPCLVMNGVTVPNATDHRNLGVTLDRHLTFSTQITNITMKFRHRVMILSYMSKTLTPDVVDRLYKGYVRPTIEYAAPACHPHLTQAQALTLERLQACVVQQFLRLYGVVLPYTTSKTDLLQRVN